MLNWKHLKRVCLWVKVCKLIDNVIPSSEIISLFLEFKRNLVLETKVFKKGALAISNQFDLNSISESSDKRAHAV